MDAIATQKFFRASPQKLREVVSMIKGMTPEKAVEILPYVGKRGAEPILKVIKSAMANASLKGMATADIVFKEIQIGKGPNLKRGIAVSR
ncbi:MAG: uL22 family ribosomal protein, partial [Patescibacteria group bacterium]